jgi:hypothetical protein
VGWSGPGGCRVFYFSWRMIGLSMMRAKTQQASRVHFAPFKPGSHAQHALCGALSRLVLFCPR